MDLVEYGVKSNDFQLKIADSDSEGNIALKSAWSELAAIEREAKRYKEIREQTEKDLELCRQKGVALEDELPERISSDDERELLALLCRGIKFIKTSLIDI